MAVMGLCAKIGGVSASAFLSRSGVLTPLVFFIVGVACPQFQSVAETTDYQPKAMPIVKSTPLPRESTSWRVQCTNLQAKRECRAGRSLNRANGRPLVSVVVWVSQDNEQPVMRLKVPNSIYLPEGVTLRVGKAPAKRLNVLYCVQSGCLAESSMTKGEIGDMLKGKKLGVWIQDRKGKSIRFRIPTAGFDKAYPKMN
jgi:invasion protein IalB